MTEQEKLMLAKANGLEKQFVDQTIGDNVRKNISPAEENAQDRKMIQAIIDALINANIPLNSAAVQEFTQYNAKVEQIKDKVKGTYKEAAK